VAGQPAEPHAEIDAVGYRSSRRDADRGKPDIGGVFEDAGAAAAVESDVELARQAVELAVVQDVVVEGAG